MLTTEKQRKFWDQLLEEKKFPGEKSADELRAEFAQLNKASGSAWIEKARGLPDKDAEDEPIQAPTF